MPKLARILAFAFLFLLSTTAAQANPHWYASKKFWVPFAVDAAAAVADYKSSQEAFRNGAQEMDPVFGSSHPGMARMTAIGLTADFALSYTGYRMSQSKHPLLRDFYWLPSAADAEDHQYFAIHNLALPVNRRHVGILAGGR